MIRGVNKTIIEISETGNECFERAILFVRTNAPGKFGENLTEMAGAYLSGLKVRRRLYRKNKLPFICTVLVSALVGAGIATAYFLLF